MKKKNEPLKQIDLENLVKGATFLASGGGGTYDSAMLFVQNFTKKHYERTEVSIIDVDDIPENDSKCAIVLAYLGTPTKLKDAVTPDAAIQSVNTIQEELKKRGKELGYIVPIEVGGISTLVSCLVGAKLNLTVINADGAGRAVPLLQMTTFATHGADVNPCVLTNSSDYKIVYEVSDSREASASTTIEALARSALSMREFDQVGGITMWTMDRALMSKAILIKGTITKCIQLGKIIGNEQYLIKPNISSIQNVLNTINYHSQIVCQGKILDAKHTAIGGFDSGLMTIQQDQTPENLIKIIFQNESLIVWDSGQGSPLVTAPDLISYLIIPEATHKRQLVYSNSDIIDPSTQQLKEELKNAEIIVLTMKAPQTLLDQESNLISSSVLKSFHEVLQNVGYYGACISFQEEA